jgi:NAD(P)-dependent dehydrogenase (short-subunit alcohol dehydrogenase family)
VLALSRRGLPSEILVWRDVRTDLGTDAGQRVAIDAAVSALAAEQWSRAVLINNAGMLEPLGVLGNADPAAVQRSIAVNLTATIVLMNAFLVHSARVPARRWSAPTRRWCAPLSSGTSSAGCSPASIA